MTEQAGSHRDPIAFTAESLGKAKTAAEQAGSKLITDFHHVERLAAQLRSEHGIDIGRVFFAEPVTQAAWLAHLGHDQGPPLMPHEDQIIHDQLAQR